MTGRTGSSVGGDLLRMAEMRVGRTTAERLRWVIDFSNRDLGLLRKEELVALGDDLQMLPRLHAAQHHHEPITEAHDSEAPSMQPDDVLKVHDSMRRGFQGLLQEPSEPWAIDAKSIFVARIHKQDAKQPQFRFGSLGTEQKSAILATVIGLLLEDGHQLRACDSCRTPFLAVRRQIFCSSECSQIERNLRKQKARDGQGRVGRRRS
jgi:hypothetical protein